MGILGQNSHARQLLGDKLARIFDARPRSSSEPVQGEGCINVPPAGYLAEAARICRAHDVLLICDEVQTGLGRPGCLFARHHDGVIPDEVTVTAHASTDAPAPRDHTSNSLRAHP